MMENEISALKALMTLQNAEIERLTETLKACRCLREDEKREIERLREEKDHWIIRVEQCEAEIERLNAIALDALEEKDDRSIV